MTDTCWEGFLENNHQYLIRLLQEEVAQSHAELQKIRSSVRYRAGSLLVEMFPPTRHTFSTLRCLLRLLFNQARDGGARTVATSNPLPESALVAETLVFSCPSRLPKKSQPSFWFTTDAVQLAAVMDEFRRPGKLVLQQLDEAVLRRLARWQLQGGSIEWQPSPEQVHSPAMLGYLQSLQINPVEPNL